MKGVHGFIITTEKRYNNTVDVDGKELIVNTEITERDAWYVNRVGIVKSIPMTLDTPVNIGDEVIVHHNVFRRWYGQHGEERNSSAYVNEDNYVVYPDQIFAYRSGGEWKSTPGYCFVKPIQHSTKWSSDVLKNLHGTIEFDNELDIPKGTEVAFTPDSEYEFNIEGELYWRILSNQISTVYEYKEKETASSKCC